MYGTGFDQFLFPFEVYSSLMSYHILYIYRNLVQSIKHVNCICNKCWLDKVSFKNFSVCNWLYFKMFTWYLKLFILDLFINIRFASNYIADFQTYFDLNLRIALKILLNKLLKHVAMLSLAYISGNNNFSCLRIFSITGYFSKEKRHNSHYICISRLTNDFLSEPFMSVKTATH